MKYLIKTIKGLSQRLHGFYGARLSADTFSISIAFSFEMLRLCSVYNLNNFELPVNRFLFKTKSSPFRRISSGKQADEAPVPYRFPFPVRES